jgi:hypothetical protein
LNHKPTAQSTPLWRSMSWQTSQQSPTILEQQPEQTIEDGYSPVMQYHPGDIRQDGFDDRFHELTDKMKINSELTKLSTLTH